MEQVLRVCDAFPMDPPETGHFWALLAYHRDYAMALARALAALARGDRAESWENWCAFRALIGREETAHQPCLDVYRVLEVTKKYTGFSPDEG